MAEDSVLKRLIQAELDAQKRVDEAFKERDEMVDGALEEARAAEERFKRRIPDLHDSFVKKAEQDAQQASAEVERRYQESADRLRSMARGAEDEALALAMAILLDPERL